MHSRASEEEKIVDIYFSDKETVLPYQTVTLTSQKEPAGENSRYVGIFFRKAGSPADSISKTMDNGGFFEQYERIGTLLKVISWRKKFMIGGGTGSINNCRFTGLGIRRIELVEFVNGNNEEAIIRIRDDIMQSEDEDLLRKDGRIAKLKDMVFKLLRMKSGNSGFEQSEKNFIYNEDNIIRLIYIISIQLKMGYDKSLEFLKIDEVSIKIDFLLAHMAENLEMHKINSVEDFSFDVTNPSDLARIEYSVENMDIPKQVKQTMKREIEKLKKSSPGVMEHSISQSYLELMLGLPWNKSSDDKCDLDEALKILDEDHSGLVKVKKRIIEFLAVRSLNKNSKGSILCFYGPPGVGKTSLGKSIARSLGRKYIRISLGGVSDESLLRGHRRTYVGAYPGMIIQAIKRAGTNNPVILLDEVDKVGNRNFHGNPSAALLEILDPAQNQYFTDHYLNVPFDISKVLFIATANRLDSMAGPLIDRFEILTIPGYSTTEKMDIANRYLVKKCHEENGLPQNTVEIDSTALQTIIQSYTQESGVRELERKISGVCRNVAVKYLGHVRKVDNEKKKFKNIKVKHEDLFGILGPPKYKDLNQSFDFVPGTCVGLAWTEVGGKVLLVETSYSKGKGLINLTGSLGDIMKESVTTAFSWIKTNRSRLKIIPEHLLSEIGEKSLQNGADILDVIDIHVHFPSAAIPKDGPSAGITICTALVSLLTRIKLRKNLAMTGEISLTGNVLPVGGIREKILAANSAGINTVLLPEDNKTDFEEMEACSNITLKPMFMRSIWRVITTALESDPIDRERLSSDMIKLHKL